MLDIPDLKEIINKIYNDYDSKDYIKDIYENIKLELGEEEAYYYFSEVYDELFANLLLKKTFVSNDTRKLLDILATPFYTKDEYIREKIYRKIEMM